MSDSPNGPPQRATNPIKLGAYIPTMGSHENNYSHGGADKSVAGGAEEDWNSVQFQNLAPTDSSPKGKLSDTADKQTPIVTKATQVRTSDGKEEKLQKPKRSRNGTTKVWRPNPSFSQDDQEGIHEAAANHSMSACTFIVALCRAYVEADPIILKQHLRPSMPPMTEKEHRALIGLCTNLNQIARVMNEGRKIAIEHDDVYPPSPELLAPTIDALYSLLRVGI